VLAAKHALAVAGLDVGQIDLFDFYSCFPIAVFNVRDGLGIAAADPRPLTMTGGLPFFGGAGNNYSMHAIASMVRALRARPDASGLVGANGGFLSKYSVGVYSARPSSWTGFDSKALQAEVDAWPAPKLVGPTAGSGIIDTYTIDYAQAEPKGIVVGRLDDGGARFVAMTTPDDATVVQTMIAREPLGARVTLEPDDAGHTLIRTLTPVG
jgi:acetyl-CoA C-acetyltransferase